MTYRPRAAFCTARAATFIITALGGSVGTTATAQCLESCEIIHELFGETAGDQYGWKSKFIGDVSGDGVGDFLATAPTNAGGTLNAGRIYAYSGADGTELWRASGPAPFGRPGNDAYRAGDIDGDDVPDVIAGAPSSGAGRAILYSGASRGVGDVIHTFFGENPGDRFGFRVAGDGDANGDGQPDLLVSATFHDTAGQGPVAIFRSKA